MWGVSATRCVTEVWPTASTWTGRRVEKGITRTPSGRTGALCQHVEKEGRTRSIWDRRHLSTPLPPQCAPAPGSTGSGLTGVPGVLSLSALGTPG